MENFNTALITGASSGIGQAFGEKLAQQGINLILVARSEDKMNELAKGWRVKYKVKVHVCPCDLSKSGAAGRILSFCKERELQVDLLINNAGFGYQGYFEQSDLNFYSEMVQVNSTALTELTYLFGKDMLTLKHGGILNVASVAGGQPVPYFSVYAATKSYVVDFSMSLWREWKSRNVHVCVLCPGPVDTNFFEVSGANPREMLLRKLQTPQQVVDIGLKAIRKKKPIVYSSISLTLLKWISSKLSPKTVANVLHISMKPTQKTEG